MSMVKIMPLSELPEAAGFCSSYIESWWEYSHSDAARIVNSCLAGESMPFILLAVEGKTVMGTIMAAKGNEDVSEKYSPWLLMLFVKEEFRNKKLGTRLVEESCKRLKELGHSAVYINTSTAEGFFKKLGWSFIEETKWRNEKTSIFSKIL